jgi:hypothetical protein
MLWMTGNRIDESKICRTPTTTQVSQAGEVLVTPVNVRGARLSVISEPDFVVAV